MSEIKNIFEIEESVFKNSKYLKSEKKAITRKSDGEKEKEIIRENTEASHPLTCKICGIGTDTEGKFESQIEQKEHFKTDWHRYNLKRYLKGKKTIKNELEFENIIDTEEVSSISGSDSEEEEEINENKGSKILFRTNDDKIFEIWKCLLIHDKSDNDPEILENNLKKLNSINKWAVILSRGGHFSAACFSRPEQNNKHNEKYIIDIHKAFHKYITRAKMGKRQSAKDNSGKYAKSAGASLRRHNEAELKKNIIEILNLWKTYLDKCDMIFVSYGVYDADALFHGEKAPLNKNDKRIRRVPFYIQRPTFSETKRITNLLLNVTFLENITKNEKLNVKANLKIEEENIIIKEIENLKIEEELNESELHKMARKGDIEAVRRLLESGENPELTNENDLTAYEVSKNEDVKKTFEKFRVNNPDKWDYEISNIPYINIKEKINIKKLNKKPKNKEINKKIEKTKEKEEDLDAILAEVKNEISRMNTKKKDKKSIPESSKKKEIEIKEENIEERRRRMAEAAEKRMSVLKNASSSQKLW